MVGVRKESSSIVAEGVSEYPVGWIVGDWVAGPLDVIGQLAFASGTVVFRIYNAVD